MSTEARIDRQIPSDNLQEKQAKLLREESIKLQGGNLSPQEEAETRARMLVLKHALHKDGIWSEEDYANHVHRLFDYLEKELPEGADYLSEIRQVVMADPRTGKVINTKVSRMMEIRREIESGRIFPTPRANNNKLNKAG